MRLFYINESATPSIKKLKDGRKSLNDEEETKARKAKAIWGDDNHLAIWKSEINGSTYYVSNTHRTYAANTSLEKTISDFHDFVKDSS